MRMIVIIFKPKRTTYRFEGLSCRGVVVLWKDQHAHGAIHSKAWNNLG